MEKFNKAITIGEGVSVSVVNPIVTVFGHYTARESSDHLNLVYRNGIKTTGILLSVEAAIATHKLLGELIELRQKEAKGE